MLPTEIAGEPVVLLPHKAVFVPRHRALLVADVHIGKAMTFRRLGVPVPHGTTDGTLARLSAAIASVEARRVVFLGDFLHSAHAHAPHTTAAVARWRQAHPGLDLMLVRGNHDDRAGDPPDAWRIAVVDEPHHLGPFALAHYPKRRDGWYTLAGHLHPCVRVQGRAHDRLRLPCFHFGAHIGVLPAFGDFTGMHGIDRASEDRVFAVAEDRVIELR